MAELENASDKVPGNNNATYGPVPKTDQLFQVEYLEIAPSPIPLNRFLFVLLRGCIYPSKERGEKQLSPDELSDATISFTLSVVAEDGGDDGGPKTYTVPLRTIAHADTAHILIRDAKGAIVDQITSSGRYDIVGDMAIIGMFVRKGTWTFGVEARLKDGTCLFSMSLTQWLEGEL